MSAISKDPLVAAAEGAAKMTSAMVRGVEDTARAAGFALAGVAAVPAPGSPEEQMQRERFAAWIDRGYAGEMHWLSRRNAAGDLLRSSLAAAVPWASSVVLCAANYNADAPRSIDPAPAGTGWIARYAWSGVRTQGSDSQQGELQPADYHTILLERLRNVESFVQKNAPGCETRCYVDTGPVVERHFAQLAGIGWIGKNTCVLNQQIGSWLLLGVVLTSLELPQTEWSFAADRCGSCTRCIDACPTDALIAPRQMDASRCISYLTIEKKGSIDPDLREGMGRQIFGCDICQDVCPWNRRAPIASLPGSELRPELVNPNLHELAAMEPVDFRRSFRGSALERTGLKRLRRNLAIAMGNSGDASFVPRLRRWAAGEDAVLAEAAAWALHRLAASAGEEPALLASVATGDAGQPEPDPAP